MNEAEVSASSASRTGTQAASGARSRRARHALFYIAVIALYVLGAVAVGWLVYHNGAYPSGSDGMAHVYKGDVLYRDILSGTWWPYVDPRWYNGVEIMRYWAPLPVYVLAGCEALAQGSIFGGYVLFCALIFFFGAVAWLCVGARLGRRGLGAFFGALWFFMPNNLLALFYEGNLPRSIALVMLPVFIWRVWDYLQHGRWQDICPITIWFALIALCHSGYAGMIALALVVWLICNGIANRQWKRGLVALVAVLAGYAVIGVWLVPSLIGGITSTSSAEVMAGFFQSLWKSLNPFPRLSGTFDFYFGLAAFIACAFGALCARRKSLPLFWAALVILLLTTSSAYPMLAALPGGQYLWMLRFISIALAFILLGLLTWDTLRKGLLVLFCALLVLDAVPSLPLLVGDMSGSQPEERYAAELDSTLIGQAQAITKQRLALIDGSRLASTGAYLVADFGNPVATSHGAGWQSAATASNIRQLNAAAEQGDFLYLFDRSKELGDDSVLIRTAFIKNYGPAAEQELDAAAERLGYSFAASNGDYRLYHLEDAPQSWGTVDRYDAIGIGTGAATLSLEYPGIEETSDADLSHYTYDQLAGYKTVYLSGFTYDDQEAAEDLVTRLSEHGTRVVISADGIPVNKNSHDRIFLGVRCNDISFSNGYPELDTAVGRLSCDLFPEDMRDWHAVYLEGLDDSWGSFSMSASDGGQEHDLDFIGTVKNDNIVMVGLNLGYFYSLTEDGGVGRLLDKATGMAGSDLPEREIVPVSVSYQPASITVATDHDDVNTTLAYHDEFDGQEGVRRANNLVVVGKGTTVLKFSYPCLWQGLLMTAGGILLLALAAYAAWRDDPAVRARREARMHPPDDLKDAPVALIVPAYQPDGKLAGMLQKMAGSWNGPIVVVNDGSDASCEPVFEQAAALPGVTVLAHEANRGKGAALKTALAWCQKHHPECVGAVTADADGQHLPEDIRAVADALRSHPDELVLGCRDFTRPDVPRRSSMGNQLSRVLLRLSCGVSVSDTQTGLRGIPLSIVPILLAIRHDRYEFETDMLAEAHRQGVSFFEVPIATVYLDENRSSHYRPVRDSARIAAVFFRYALSSLACSVIDLGLFGVLVAALGALPASLALPAATLVARVASAAVNFAINRHLVFKTRGSAARYLVLAVVSAAASALLVTGIVVLTGFNAVAVKIVVDVALFFANYAAQRLWVFAEGQVARLQTEAAAR